jgi:hemolysin D
MKPAEKPSAEVRRGVVLPWPRTPAGRRTQLEFLPAALEIIETPASPVGRAIGGTIVLLIVLALVWSIFGRVDIIATASGKIVPTGRTKTVQPLGTGVVAEIRVQDGDVVTAGQELVRLDHTTSEADRNRVAHDLMNSQLEVARLSALRAALDTGTPPALEPPAEAPRRQVERVRAAMVAAAEAQAAKVAGVDQQIAQKDGEAEEVAATIAKLEASLPLLQETADIRSKARAIEYGNRIADLDAQTRLVEQQHELIVQQRRASQIPAARKALEQQRAQAVAEYASKILSDLADAEQKVSELSEDLVKAQQKLGEEVLRAPVDGTVQQLAVHSVGGVVTPAQQLMMIVPSDSRIEAEAMISNRDIGFVQPGEDAEIKIDTFNFTRYGLLHGKVVSVSRDAIVRDKPMARSDSARSDAALADSSEPQGQEYLFAARVSLDRTEMEVEGGLVKLTSGMAVTVEIKTGTRRVIEYLLSPLLRYRHDSLRER